MKGKGLSQHQQKSQNDIHPSSGWLQRAAVREVLGKEVESPVEGELGLNRSFVSVPVRGGRLPIVQRKLTIGAVGDRYEREAANRVASQVLQRINVPDSTQITQEQSVQRQEASEEEGILAKPEIISLQRKEAIAPIQREEMRDEERDELQMKPMVQRRADGEEASEDLASGINRSRVSATPADQLQKMADNHSAQQQQPIQKKKNNTGLPDNLKTGMENLAGMSLDDVKVHRNSDKPAQLQAHAYAQGTDIHLASGQEKHLPHEAWHVVQQKQGRVKPTMRMKRKVNINDDVGLEKEADVMGAKAFQIKEGISTNLDTFGNTSNQVVQKASDEQVQAMIFEFVQLKASIKGALSSRNKDQLEKLIKDLLEHVRYVLKDQDYELKANAYSAIYKYVDGLFDTMYRDYQAICEMYFYDIQDLLRDGTSTLDYSVEEAEEEITCTAGPFGTASGIAGEHVTFSDGMKWGIKRAPGVGFVYFEIREGNDPGGTRFNDPYNKSGYNPGQMKQFLVKKGLGKHWEAFWKITKLKGGS